MIPATRRPECKVEERMNVLISRLMRSISRSVAVNGRRWAVSCALFVMLPLCGSAQPSAGYSGNPVLEGWYADPDAAVLDGNYWIVPTTSVDHHEQRYFDAFSSPDLVRWTRHERVVDDSIVTWGRSCFWAPGIATRNGKYYIFFSAKGVDESGRPLSHSIGVCVADDPAGPYRDLLGKPLLSERYNGAQPIDQCIFRDGEEYYMLYGGEGHCNIVRLNADFTGFLPHADGSVFKEITPENYVEGPVMFKRGGKYYFMWSEGLWFASNYRVAYAIADSPCGPFERIGTVLTGDDRIASGPGHHAVLRIPGSDETYIVYHRRPLGDKDGNHRVTCIDRLEFDSEGRILPVKMTVEGVEARPLE